MFWSLTVCYTNVAKYVAKHLPALMNLGLFVFNKYGVFVVYVYKLNYVVTEYISYTWIKSVYSI